MTKSLIEMKKNLLFVLGILTFMLAKGQSDDQVTLDFYGFVRVDAYMDTYKSVDAGHDIFYLLPAFANSGGVEYNNQPSANISAIASRLGVRIKFPEVLNAKATGLLEFDFAGNLKTDPTLFRIRQAFSLLSWEKSSLLIGQTWHPFFGGSNLPTVAGLNTGAPFSCFNRSPMIRYNMKFGGATLSASMVSEMQYATLGADDFIAFQTTNHAKRNAVIPEMVLTAEWSKSALTFGAGAQYKLIKPRMLVRSSDLATTSMAEELLPSTAFMAYGKFKNEKLTVLAKGFFGENMSHLVMPGGYGVASYDPATGKETYTNYTTYTTSLNIVYGQKWQFGVFLGYGANLGTAEKLYDNLGKAKTYGSFLNMQDMNRIAPHISLNLPKLKLVAEYERTAANYGTGAIDLSNGLYATKHEAVNHRIVLVMTQFF
jgi:hypothetical protein